MQSLNKEHLSDFCDRLNPSAKCFVFDSLPSTNAWLAQQPVDQSSLVICACDQQISGKGRSGKEWHSQPGEDVAVSFRWRYPADKSLEIASLSLVTALVLAACCQSFSSELIEIKWPNDLICQHRKLAGILLEQLPEGEVVVGIGVNLAPVSASRAKLISQDAIGLSELSSQLIDRTDFLKQLIVAMHEALQKFASTGFQSFYPQWEARDYLKDHPLTHQLGDSIRQGVGRGITQKGELILEDGMGQERLIHAGTIRRQDIPVVD